MATQPPKPPSHLRRDFVERRTHPEQDRPPETPEDARRELGFDLIPENNEVDDR